MEISNRTFPESRPQISAINFVSTIFLLPIEVVMKQIILPVLSQVWETCRGLWGRGRRSDVTGNLVFYRRVFASRALVSVASLPELKKQIHEEYLKNLNEQNQKRM